MQLSEEAFQGKVLEKLATIEANQKKDAEALKNYQVKVDELIGQQKENGEKIESALHQIKEVRNDLKEKEGRLTKELSKKEELLRRELNQKEELLRRELDNKDDRLRQDMSKEVANVYRTAAIVGACISFVISLVLKKLG